MLIPAAPQPGMAYRQEYLAGEAEDEAAVLSVSEMVEAPTGRYTDALLTRETTPLEPNGGRAEVLRARHRPGARASGVRGNVPRRAGELHRRRLTASGQRRSRRSCTITQVRIALVSVMTPIGASSCHAASCP